MLYTISKLNRTVELNDELVDEYQKYEILRDNPFSIIIKSKYGYIPTEDELSTEDLSKICNEILFSELKAMALLPESLNYIHKNQDMFVNTNECIEVQL